MHKEVKAKFMLITWFYLYFSLGIQPILLQTPMNPVHLKTLGYHQDQPNVR